MDITKTRRQLIDQVLANLQVLALGQTPADEDVQKVDGIIDGAVDELNARDIIYIDDAGQPGPLNGAISSGVFLALADFVTNASAAQFGLAADPALVTLASAAESRLRTIARPAGTRKKMQIDRALSHGRRPLFNFTSGQ